MKAALVIRPFLLPVGSAGAVAGTLVCDDPLLLAVGSSIGLLWLVQLGIGRAYARFLVRFWMPLEIALLLLWGWIVGAPPDHPVGSDPSGGIRYALVVGFRLVLVAAIGQGLLLSVPATRLPSALRYHNVPLNLIVVSTGARALIDEIAVRLEQVWTARLARGVVVRRTRRQYVRHFPMMLRPLLAWMLRSAVLRSDLWQRRALLTRMASVGPQHPPSRPAAELFAASGLAWLTLAIVVRWWT